VPTQMPSELGYSPLATRKQVFLFVLLKQVLQRGKPQRFFSVDLSLPP